MGGKHLRDAGRLMPGRVSNRDNDRLAQGSGIGPGEVVQRSRKGVLQPCGFRDSTLAFGLGWTLDSAGRQLTTDMVRVVESALGTIVALRTNGEAACKGTVSRPSTDASRK